MGFIIHLNKENSVLTKTVMTTENHLHRTYQNINAHVQVYIEHTEIYWENYATVILHITSTGKTYKSCSRRAFLTTLDASCPLPKSDN